MSNELIVAPPGAPAYLASFLGGMPTLAGIADNISGGLSSGSAHPRISIKGSRWRIQDVQGDVQVAQTLHLDAIIVDANPFLSKTFYAQAYNPADMEVRAPDCFSDNGAGPSSRAEKPQAAVCSSCPHNAWGSKINPNGSKSKACADSKKLAVLLADNPEGAVYELRVPAASMANLAAALKSLQQRGIPAPAVVIRMTFDPQADFPKIVFTPTGYATEAQLTSVKEVMGTGEVAEAVGSLDTVRVGGAPAITAPVAAPAPAQAAPFPVAPAAPAPVAAAPFPQAPAPAPFATPTAEAPKRTRAKKAEPVAPVAPPSAFPTPGVVTPFPQAPTPAPAFATPVVDQPFSQPAAAAVSVSPPATSADLDALLGDALA